jgi:hypothetical protein
MEIVSMKRYPVHVSLILTLFSLLFPLIVVKADIGPKPTMTFNFKFQGDPIAIEGGQQLQCSDATCADGTPLTEGGPQRFHCDARSCGSLAYAYKPYHKLIIQFADRTRESNVFQKRAFSATYTVTVTENWLQVEETPSGLEALAGGPYQGYDFPVALLATIIIETSVVLMWVAGMHLPISVLLLAPLASLISLPVVWYVFPRLLLPSTLTILLSEIFAVVFEAGFLYFLSRKAMTFRHALVMSAVMNAFSFVAGYVVLSTP